MLFNLIAIDPGGETGIAHASFNPMRWGKSSDLLIRSAFEMRMARAFQIGGSYNQQTVTLMEYIQDEKKKAGHGYQDTYEVRTIVICEDFVLGSRVLRKSALIPVKVAAKLEFYVWLEFPEGDVEWVWQNPGEREVIAHDMLRKWDLWQPGKANKDAMAALQHLFLYARKLEKMA